MWHIKNTEREIWFPIPWKLRGYSSYPKFLLQRDNAGWSARPLTRIFSSLTSLVRAVEMLCKRSTTTAMFPGIWGDFWMLLMMQAKSLGHFSISISAMVWNFLRESSCRTIVDSEDWTEYNSPSSWNRTKRKKSFICSYQIQKYFY